jgi:TIR domain
LGQPLRNFLTEAHQYEVFLLSLNQTLQEYPERILTHTQNSPPSSSVTDLFISYSSRDAEFVAKLANDLTACGVIVWWDKWVMKVGDSLHKKIQDGITNSAWLGVVLSPNSVSSPWVEKELNSALMKELEQKKVFVLPILYRDCQIPLLLKDKIYADFRSSYKLGLDTLLDRFTPRIRLDLLDGLMSGSNSAVSACYAKIRPEDKKLYGNELLKRMDSSSAQERANALTGLFVIRDTALSTHLLKLANDSADTVRRLAIFLPGRIESQIRRRYDQ